VTFSEYYRDFMSEFLTLPKEKFQIVPLGVRVEDFRREKVETSPPETERPPTIGYLARICPEKGLHVLCEAFRLLRQMTGTQNARLRIAGWLGKRDEMYFQQE